jgi:glucose/arabinose dehydrogenase
VKHTQMTGRAFVVALVITLAPLAQAGPFLPSIQLGSIGVGLQPIATGLAAPDYGFSPPGDASRLFVLEQNGLVRVIQNGSLLPTPALNLQSLVSPPLNPTNANDERGLLGIAFAPGFNDPNSIGFRTVYTYNSEAIPAGTSPTFPVPAGAPALYKNAINEWKMSASNPNVIDPTSMREVVSFGKNAQNHNGGTITFGPDGYLYLATGDGGLANDSGLGHIAATGNAQDLSVPLGKMLRIDPYSPALEPISTNPVSGNGQYRTPADNPFQQAGQLKEIYAYGLRNPYRFSFDTVTGDLIEGDVGQNTIEVINRIVKGGNYGWAVKEGTFPFNRANGTVGVNSPGVPAGLIDPISGTLGTLEYDHSDGISITGGFVYRGSGIPELYGKYVFGDLALFPGPPARANGRLFYADLTTGVINEFQLPQFAGGKIPNGLTVHGFGEDANGELYAMMTNTPANGTGGIVYKLVSTSVVPEPGTMLLTALAFAGLIALGRRK